MCGLSHHSVSLAECVRKHYVAFCVLTLKFYNFCLSCVTEEYSRMSLTGDGPSYQLEWNGGKKDSENGWKIWKRAGDREGKMATIAIPQGGSDSVTDRGCTHWSLSTMWDLFSCSTHQKLWTRGPTNQLVCRCPLCLGPGLQIDCLESMDLHDNVLLWSTEKVQIGK